MKLAALLVAVLPQAAFPGPSGDVGPPLPGLDVSSPPAALSTLPPREDPFTPERVLTVRNGARVLKLPANGAPLVAIRVSVRVEEGVTQAGAGKLLQMLATERLESRAAGMGLRFEGSRTPWGISYTVVGARSALDEITALLRESLAAPDVSEVDFERHRRALHDDVLRITETPAARIVTELRARAAPGSPPIDGTPGTVARMTRATLREVWTRSHHPEEMIFVVSGDVPDDELTSAFRDLTRAGGPGRGGGGISSPPSSALRTQVFRHWYGEAYRVADPRDPHGAVVALLAADRLRTTTRQFEAEVQLLELEDVQLLTALAAAYPAEADGMRKSMPGLLADTRQALTTEDVRSAVSRARQAMLQQARTPEGLVTVVGRHMDASGDPEAARRFLAELDRVTLESTRTFIAQLERQAPLRVEVRP